MRENHGVDMTTHRSAMLSETDVLEATHIYCMAQRHQDAVLTLKKRIAASNSSQQSLGPSSSSSSTPSSWPNAAEKADGGNRKKTPPPSRAPVVVSVFQPEVPDPWHGTIELYRECAEIISTAVKRVLDEDISVIPDPRQDQQQADGVPADPRHKE